MESIKEHYDSMVKAIETYTPSADMLRINAALEYAIKKHANQKRK